MFFFLLHFPIHLNNIEIQGGICPNCSKNDAIRILSDSSRLVYSKLPHPYGESGLWCQILPHKDTVVLSIWVQIVM